MGWKFSELPTWQIEVLHHIDINKMEIQYDHKAVLLTDWSITIRDIKWKATHGINGTETTLRVNTFLSACGIYIVSPNHNEQPLLVHTPLWDNAHSAASLLGTPSENSWSVIHYNSLAINPDFMRILFKLFWVVDSTLWSFQKL